MVWEEKMLVHWYGVTLLRIAPVRVQSFVHALCFAFSDVLFVIALLAVPQVDHILAFAVQAVENFVDFFSSSVRESLR